MGGKARDLLGHVDAGGEQADLLADALLVQGRHGFAQAHGQALLVLGQGLGQLGRRLGHQGAHALHPLQDHGRQLVALAAAGGHQIVQGGAGQGQDLAHQDIGRQALVGQYPRPAQHFRHRQRPGIRQDVAHRALGAAQLLQQGTVDRQFVGGGGRGEQVEAAFHLAPVQARGDQLPQLGFGQAQVLADAEIDVQVARIDSAQLQMENASPDVAAAGRVPRHAVDH